jgi:peroxiredoxin
METLNDNAISGKKSFEWLKIFDPVNIILVISIVLALGYVVTVARNNRSLAKANQRLTERNALYSMAQVGDAVPPFNTRNLNGQAVEVGRNPAAKELLFVFSTFCSACETQLPIWEKLAAQIKSKDVIVRAVTLDSMDETKAYFSGKNVSLPIVLAPKEMFSRTYRVSSIPQIMLLDKDRVVEWVHTGSMTPDKIQELASRIEITASDIAGASTSSPGH